MKAIAMHGTPPPRTVIGSVTSVWTGAETVATSLPSVRGTEEDALGHYAIPDEVPQGDQKLARQGDDQLLARAASVCRAGFKPLSQGAFLLESEEAPRELDHSLPHSSIAGSGEPLLAALAPAFVRRAGEPAVARDGATVAQVPRQDLIDQHVRRLDPHPDHADQSQDPPIWSCFRGLLQLFQAGLLDLTYLLAILQCSRSPRSQPRNARFKPSVSRRSVLARRCSRDTATLAA